MGRHPLRSAFYQVQVVLEFCGHMSLIIEDIAVSDVLGDVHCIPEAQVLLPLFNRHVYFYTVDAYFMLDRLTIWINFSLYLKFSWFYHQLDSSTTNFVGMHCLVYCFKASLIIWRPKLRIKHKITIFLRLLFNLPWVCLLHQSLDVMGIQRLHHSVNKKYFHHYIIKIGRFFQFHILQSTALIGPDQ